MASRFFGARYCAAVQSRRAFLVHVHVAQRRIAEIERAEMSNCSECEEEEGGGGPSAWMHEELEPAWTSWKGAMKEKPGVHGRERSHPPSCRGSPAAWRGREGRGAAGGWG